MVSISTSASAQARILYVVLYSHRQSHLREHEPFGPGGGSDSAGGFSAHSVHLPHLYCEAAEFDAQGTGCYRLHWFTSSSTYLGYCCGTQSPSHESPSDWQRVLVKQQPSTVGLQPFTSSFASSVCLYWSLVSLWPAGRYSWEFLSP